MTTTTMISKNNYRVSAIFLLLSVLLLLVEASMGFIVGQRTKSAVRLQQRDEQFTITTTTSTSTTSLFMAKAAKKKKKKTGGGGGGGLKGFGSVATAKKISSSSSVDLDRSKDALSFYDFLSKGSAQDTLSRCAMGYFDISDDFKLRGVVALKPIKKGDNIIRIPYELAVNLGQEGADPTVPAVALLREYCEVLGQNGNDDDDDDSTTSTSERAAYYKMLPPFKGEDCMGSTDFFSDAALEALQNPLISEETIERREKVQVRFATDIDDSFPKWIDGTDVTVEHLQWAVWIITSRVLTVQGDASEGKSYRLLIPFLDMCNHDRSSPHVLTGRAVPGGELKVVAGANIKEGDQINICYGGGVAGNDRFLQDYGFLDVDNKENKAFVMVAQQLLGKRRILEGAGAGRLMMEADREDTLARLRLTTMAQDKELLASETDPGMQAAIKYRLGVKEALSKFIMMQ